MEKERRDCSETRTEPPAEHELCQPECRTLRTVSWILCVVFLVAFALPPRPFLVMASHVADVNPVGRRETNRKGDISDPHLAYQAAQQGIEGLDSAEEDTEEQTKGVGGTSTIPANPSLRAGRGFPLVGGGGPRPTLPYQSKGYVSEKVPRISSLPQVSSQPLLLVPTNMSSNPPVAAGNVGAMESDLHWSRSTIPLQQRLFQLNSDWRQPNFGRPGAYENMQAAPPTGVRSPVTRQTEHTPSSRGLEYTNPYAEGAVGKVVRDLPRLEGRRSLAAAGLLYLLTAVPTPLLLSLAGVGLYRFFRSHASREKALLRALAELQNKKGGVPPAPLDYSAVSPPEISLY